MKQKTWLNTKEIADYIGISQPTLRVWIHKKIIPVHRINQRNFFNINEIDTILLKN